LRWAGRCLFHGCVQGLPRCTAAPGRSCRVSAAQPLAAGSVGVCGFSFGDVSTAPAGQRCREVCCGHGNGNVRPRALCRPARPLLDHSAAVCARPTLFQRHRCTTPPHAAPCCPVLPLWSRPLWPALDRGSVAPWLRGFAMGSPVFSTGVSGVSSYRPLGLASLFGLPLPRGRARCSIALAGRPGRPLLALVGFCRVMPTLHPHVPCPRASCKPLEPVTATAVSVSAPERRVCCSSPGQTPRAGLEPRRS
jgi:hypothetical protein